MSWSVTVIGEPEKVAVALEEHSRSLSGQSKIEFDDALPHLQAIVRQNFRNDGQGQIVELDANGSGTSQGDKQLNRSCSVKITSRYGRIAV